ncbi:hypothetical protein [Planosporangium mesophilum]|uniref:Uncharacterized protein n=1 Tax=Planosporangium mesophilum TaxID=689768 RepID=A0A8J3X0Q7_9ACTN|nr:hypothetical protein [Planosporangium mesophilum]GII22564.1 hypothetical protein Pme01_21610 [Planosporangium mesophilum]
MIVAVTGPSAAGKTTWCRRHHVEDLVGEYVPTGAEPDDTDLPAQAAFWCAVNCQRWQAAIHRERVSGLAVCDDDPLKLHYSWSLVRIGAASRKLWTFEVAANRAAIADGRLGFADVVLVSLPSVEELHRRRDADPVRRRRNFALHVQLAQPLREWYEALDMVAPGRVRWELPSDGLPAVLPAARPDRCDPAVLDALIEALPGVG